MSMEIEVPVGGTIIVHGSEVVCKEDYIEKGETVGCGACPVPRGVCTHLACGFAYRSDFKDVHFEYYYGEK